MDILEELWYGNVNPMEMNNIQNNPEYQSALRLVNNNYDRLQEGLTDKQKQLLMRRGFKDSNLFGFGRFFLTNSALKKLAIHKVLLRSFALPLQKIGRPKL